MSMLEGALSLEPALCQNLRQLLQGENCPASVKQLRDSIELKGGLQLFRAGPGM